MRRERDEDFLQFLRDCEEPQPPRIIRMALPNPSHGEEIFRYERGPILEITYEDGFVRTRVGKMWIN